MAAESPGGALLAPQNTDVVDPPGTAVLAPPAMPKEADEYVLRTLKMGPSTTPPSAIQPTTDTVIEGQQQQEGQE